MNQAALRQLWLSWWNSCGAWGRWLPFAIAGAFLATHAALGGIRIDHVELGLASLVLYYAGPAVREVAKFLMPLIIMAVIYDFQRYWAVPLRGTIHVAEPRNWELAWFGIGHGMNQLTPAQWCQLHLSPALDVITGVAYLVFIPLFLGCVAWWRFREKRPDAIEVMWVMLALNLAAYLTYLIYPAAPPWYADHYGLGPALVSAAPEPGGGARFDALLGVSWFAHVYGRNANVFGAIPSLHVGQTFLAVLYAWRFRSLRSLTTGFWLLVTFSSVYLNHHYLVDGIAGMAFSLAAFLVARAIAARNGLTPAVE